MAKSRLVNLNGAPAIEIDGKIYPPMTATVTTSMLALGSKERKTDREYYENFGKSGIKIYYVMCNNLGLDPNAVEDSAIEAGTILDAIPDAYIMVRMNLITSDEWIKNNPDDVVTYSDGKRIPAKITAESFYVYTDAMPSLCSEKWRNDMGETMLRTIEGIQKLPFADRICGYFLGAGGTSEWYYINPIENYADGSKYISADLLREVARFAGCHIFEEDGHVLYANKNFITVHAVRSGDITLKFKMKCSPFELYEEKYYGENANEITFNVKRGDTKMFSINGF